jgi:hypothetical protein
MAGEHGVPNGCLIIALAPQGYDELRKTCAGHAPHFWPGASTGRASSSSPLTSCHPLAFERLDGSARVDGDGLDQSSIHFNNLVVWGSPNVGQLQTKPWTNAHSFRILRGTALLALLSFRAIIVYGTTQIQILFLSPSRRHAVFVLEELSLFLRLGYKPTSSTALLAGLDFLSMRSIGRVQNQ